MSRSRRKNSICGNTCSSSDKWWKQKSSRKFRKVTKQNLKEVLNNSEVEEDFPDGKSVSNVYDSPKDGKNHFDAEEHPEFMRK